MEAKNNKSVLTTERIKSLPEKEPLKVTGTKAVSHYSAAEVAGIARLALPTKRRKITQLHVTQKARAPIHRNHAFTELLDSVPTETKSTIKMLSDDTRLVIVLALLRDGEKSFSELAENLGIEKNLLSHHLKILCQTALIKNFYMKKNETDHSYYEASNIAKDFAQKLL